MENFVSKAQEGQGEACQEANWAKVQQSVRRGQDPVLAQILTSYSC